MKITPTPSSIPLFQAAHLARFRANFASVPAVALPSPIAATEGVLVETYERGASVARYMARRAPFNPQIVAAGVDAYLKMLLSDGFIHTGERGREREREMGGGRGE